MTLTVRIVTDAPERFDRLAAALRTADCTVEFAVDPDLPAPADLVLSDPELAPGTLDQGERRHIAATLRHTRGNKRQAAQLLGIARSTLLFKVRRYGLDVVGREGRSLPDAALR